MGTLCIFSSSSVLSECNDNEVHASHANT